MVEKLFNFYPEPYSLQDFMYAYSLDNPQFKLLMCVAAFTFLIGYLEYVWSFKLIRREHSAPYPVWMHTFYFAHDSMGAILFALASKAVGGFWFFTAASMALMVWNLFEVYNLYKCIYVERQAIWGHLSDKPVTIKDAWLRVIGQLCVFIPLVNLFRIFMQDQAMFSWFIFTNVLIAIIPGLYWEKRKTQVGASFNLAIIILIGTINSFHTWNMWVLTTDYYNFTNNPWFYILGVVSIGFAIRNVYIYKKLPKKQAQVVSGFKSVK